MDYRLLFTQRALTDLAEIIGYIAEDDSEAASRFGATLLDHVELLTRFPRMGEAVSERSGVRRLAHSPILVYYRVDDDARLVKVLHLRHGSRQSPKL